MIVSRAAFDGLIIDFHTLHHPQQALTLLRDAAAQGMKIGSLDAEGEALERPGLANLVDLPAGNAHSCRSAAAELGVDAERLAIITGDRAATTAAREAGIGLIIAITGTDEKSALRQAGAHVVLDMLDECEIAPALPSAIDEAAVLANYLAGRHLALFLDYDGTLAEIAERPELARVSDKIGGLVAELARHYPLAIVSGRGLDDVRAMLGVEGLTFAGSHGFEISGPGIERLIGADWQDDLAAARLALRGRLAQFPGALLEEKRFGFAIHYRQVAPPDQAALLATVSLGLSGFPRLRQKPGKKVVEILPDFPWDKGYAVRELMQAMGVDGQEWLPLYIGDDVTDEDAFAALRGRGVGILVDDSGASNSNALFMLNSPQQVELFLGQLLARCEAADREVNGRSQEVPEKAS